MRNSDWPRADQPERSGVYLLKSVRFRSLAGRSVVSSHYWTLWEKVKTECRLQRTIRRQWRALFTLMSISATVAANTRTFHWNRATLKVDLIELDGRLLSFKVCFFKFFHKVTTRWKWVGVTFFSQKTQRLMMMTEDILIRETDADVMHAALWLAVYVNVCIFDWNAASSSCIYTVYIL